MWYLLSHCLSTRAYSQQVGNCLQAEAAQAFRFCCAVTVFRPSNKSAYRKPLHEKGAEVPFSGRFSILSFKKFYIFFRLKVSNTDLQFGQYFPAEIQQHT